MRLRGVDRGKVGDRAALLQHEGDAGNVGHKGRGLLCPGDVAVDVSADHGVAWFGVERLLGGGMEDETVDALGEPVVGNLFQGVRGLVPPAVKDSVATMGLP